MSKQTIDLGEYVIEIEHQKGKVLEICVFDELEDLVESMKITDALTDDFDYESGMC